MYLFTYDETLKLQLRKSVSQRLLSCGVTAVARDLTDLSSLTFCPLFLFIPYSVYVITELKKNL